MSNIPIGRIEADTPKAARDWLERLVHTAELIRSDENLRPPWGSDPLEGQNAMTVELAKAILLLAKP